MRAQVPNPYFGEGSDALHYWARGLAQIYERVAQRPFESRIPRAFWRGMIRNHDRDRLEERCSLEVGNEAPNRAERTTSSTFSHVAHCEA